MQSSLLLQTNKLRAVSIVHVFADKLEKRFGHYAVANLLAGLIGGQVVVWFGEQMLRAQQAPVSLIERIALFPDRVLDGEVWRLFTFMFQPPNEPAIFVIFYWLILYMFGTTLEQHWGTFRLNLYLFVGYLATTIVSFIVPTQMATNGYLYTSLFLAFAHLFPDYQIYLFFILPVKVKWLALLTWIVLRYNSILADFPIG